MGRMDRDALLAQWRAEEQQPFSGWDFSYLAKRMFEDGPPWDYLARAAKLMTSAQSALDMDTGGAEKLLALRPHWPPRVVATEEYPPNVSLARSRLEPLGVAVVVATCSDNDPMPFADGEFDLILNRHAAFNAREVARMLMPGGSFLTQQVDGRWTEDLLAHFGTTPQLPHVNLLHYTPLIETAGLDLIETYEWTGTLRFTDVGAIVYYLKAVPWEVPDFSVARYADELLALQEQLEAGAPLAFLAKYYLIEARKRQ